MKPKVTLVSSIPHPMETMAVLWEASKGEGKLQTVEDIVKQNKFAKFGASKQGDEVKLHPQVKADLTGLKPWKSSEGLTVDELFWKILEQRIPIGESLTFIFMLENVSVSFREQMVRHRIGTAVGPSVGVDIVPDLASSSFWSQSMRIQDMGAFADNEMYRVPESLKGVKVRRPDWYDPDSCATTIDAEELFHAHMTATQDVYNAFVEAKVPMEDAREIMPLGAQQRVSWTINLQALLHVLGKRGCWILQLGIWGPIIRGMISELATKVHPAFKDLLRPPCIGGDGKFKQCVYRLENQRRLTGDDKLPPCPLYVCRDADGVERVFGGLNGSDLAFAEKRREALLNGPSRVPMQTEMNERAKDYADIWQHDPYCWWEKK